MSAPAVPFEHQEGPAQPCVACDRPTTMVDLRTGQRRHIFVPDVVDCRSQPHGIPPRPAAAALAANERSRTVGSQPPAGWRRPAARPARAGATFKRPDQEEAYRQRLAILDAMDPHDDSEEAIDRAASALRIIEAMTDDPGGDNAKGGPFAPAKYGTAAPYWTARLPDIAPPLVAHSAWSYRRDTDYRGPVAVLDRNAGHPSALSSLRVALGQLEPTGPLPDASRPGYYKTVVQSWTRADLPNPMPGRKPGAEVWVTHERMRLLEQLAALGADWWPDAPILDSRTAELEVPLRELSQLIKHLRAYVIDHHGKDSPQWEAIKEASNRKLLQILMGSPRDAGALDSWTDRKWFTKCRRTDWGHALHDKAAMNLWRAAAKLVDGGIPVLAIRNMDELLIPAARVHVALERELIKEDETGRTFGTFKTKAREQWGD